MDYKEKLEEAKRLYETANADQKYLLESLFPELKSKAYERIRKNCIHFLKLQKSHHASTVEIDECIDWLEDQVKYLLEKQGEQKPADKVEPRFKIGDWVVTGKGDTVQIGVVNNGYYTLYNGMDFSISYVDKCWHLWTLSDAKDGDVLSFNDGHGNDCIELIKSITNEKIEFWFCLTNGNRYEVFDGIIPYTNLASRESATLATKEQRDLLFSKMREAGYEWDAEKKELKEVDELPKCEDYGIDGLYAAIDILKKTLGKVDGYQTDDGILEHECAISAVKSFFYEHKLSWNVEDEDMLDTIIYDLERHGGKEDSCYSAEITWLKSLRDRVQPKHEWKQENTDDLTDFENAMMHIGGSFFGENAGLDPNDTNAIKEQAQYLLELAQNSAWSEEDEEISQGIWDEILANKHEAKEYEWKTYDKFLNWLKSIKDRIQSKQEWSAEDKRNFLDVTCIVDEVWSNQKVREEIDHSSEELELLWHWLDNIWQRVKYPQDTWKPSDEQMDALYTYIYNPQYFNSPDPRMELVKSLYNDLKKLKE